MSLYNMLFGVNQAAPVLLAALGLSVSDVPRFRDAYVAGDRIVIHTRTGGGNRDYYENAETCRANYPEYFKGENDPSGPWNDDLRANPHYDQDADDDFDSTYADFFFRFPDEYAADLQAYAAANPAITPSEKWQALLAALEAKPDDR
jgi:hypothetical protein